MNTNMNITLDAPQIADLVFSDNKILEEYKLAISNTLLELDLTTLFELLIIISTEGLKKYYGTDHNDTNNTKIVDLTQLSSKDFDYINKFLKKLNVKLNVEIINKFLWSISGNIRRISYKELEITHQTTLEELFYIINKNDYIVMSFNRLS